jgi:alpha-ketoglutarate-dependent taurine dioxygenase
MSITSHVPTEALDVRCRPGSPAVLVTPGFDDLDDALAWLTRQRAAIRAELLHQGSLMIRGLPVRDTAGFAAARDILMPQRTGYREKATPRTDFGAGVFSSTDLPAAQPIRLHNENSYTLEFPGTLLFGCLTAPEEGGATTVGDMRAVLRLLPDGLRERFAAHGWLLVRNYSELAGLPWQTTFGTDDPAVVQQYCTANVIGYRWLTGGALRTEQRRPAVVTHPLTGEQSWFNHYAFWNRWALDADVRDVLVETYGEDGLPFDTYVGDGSPLTQAEVETVMAAYEQVTVRENWHEGDLMLVDNILNAHGRESFTGARKIVVAMGDPVALADCAPQPAPSGGPCSISCPVPTGTPRNGE